MNARRSIGLMSVLAAALYLAQVRGGRALSPYPDRSGRYVRIEGGLVVTEDELRTARETETHSSGTPNWTKAPGFAKDVFTFARVVFQSDPDSRSVGGSLRWLGWWVDYPDADLNSS
jgi:hypothetical protein